MADDEEALLDDDLNLDYEVDEVPEEELLGDDDDFATLEDQYEEEHHNVDINQSDIKEEDVLDLEPNDGILETEGEEDEHNVVPECDSAQQEDEEDVVENKHQRERFISERPNNSKHTPIVFDCEKQNLQRNNRNFNNRGHNNQQHRGGFRNRGRGSFNNFNNFNNNRPNFNQNRGFFHNNNRGFTHAGPRLEQMRPMGPNEYNQMQHESKTVHINPHFRGNVQPRPDARLIWDPSMVNQLHNNPNQQNFNVPTQMNVPNSFNAPNQHTNQFFQQQQQQPQPQPQPQPWLNPNPQFGGPNLEPTNLQVPVVTFSNPPVVNHPPLMQDQIILNNPQHMQQNIPIQQSGFRGRDNNRNNRFVHSNNPPNLRCVQTNNLLNFNNQQQQQHQHQHQQQAQFEPRNQFEFQQNQNYNNEPMFQPNQNMSLQNIPFNSQMIHQSPETHQNPHFRQNLQIPQMNQNFVNLPLNQNINPLPFQDQPAPQRVDFNYAVNQNQMNQRPLQGNNQFHGNSFQNRNVQIVSPNRNQFNRQQNQNTPNRQLQMQKRPIQNRLQKGQRLQKPIQKRLLPKLSQNINEPLLKKKKLQEFRNLHEVPTVDVPDTTSKNDFEDEEMKAYRLKIEEQKRKREEFIRLKEERRKRAAALKEDGGITVTSNEPVITVNIVSTTPKVNKIATINRTLNKPVAANQKPILSKSAQALKQGNRIAITKKMNIQKKININQMANRQQLIMVMPNSNDSSNRIVRTVQVNQHNTETEELNKEHLSSFLSTRIVVPKMVNPSGNANEVNTVCVGNVNTSVLPKTPVVSVSNLAASTSELKLRKLCKGVGVVQNIQMLPELQQAIIRFKNIAMAHNFYKKYQRKMVDLSLISVKLVQNN